MAFFFEHTDFAAVATSSLRAKTLRQSTGDPVLQERSALGIIQMDGNSVMSTVRLYADTIAPHALGISQKR
jgi:hypothetical protein